MGDIDSWLERFVEEHSRSFESALAEIAAGKKGTHWMWFVFPQVPRRGDSPTAARYAVPSLDHAIAFVSHPVVGANYATIVSEALRHLEKSSSSTKVLDLFGRPDHLKFVSSVTLMGAASRRAGIEDLARDCERALEIARADGMSDCAMTRAFLEGS